MADDATCVGDLSDVAGAVTPVGSAPVPDLVVEQNDAARPAQVVVDLALPLGVLEPLRGRGAEQMGAGDHFGAAVLDIGDVCEVVVGGEEEDWEMHVGRRGSPWVTM